ncbi:MAG: ABC transporter permease [Acidimicrobiales bacterium]
MTVVALGVTHTGYITMRAVRRIVRQPWYVFITLIQPMIWLLLFGQVFRRVVEIPGFGGGSYITYLTPGVVVMTALFSSAWAGTTFIDDMDRGVMDHLLVTPVRRGAMIAGSLVQQALSIAIQAIIVILVGLGMGARYPGGFPGVVVTVVAALLLAMAFASYSNALALLTRQLQTLIGIVNFLVLPLSFLSSTMIDLRVSPAWIGDVARYNPVNWAVVASRGALSANPSWSSVLEHLGLLAAVAVVLGWLATRAFRAYQRSA